jgi:Holliday junction resolvase-like predicted endonuclease
LQRISDRHQLGAHSEARVALHLIERGWLIYTQEFRVSGPVDIAALHPDGHVLLVDAKSDKQRIIKGRKTPSRIHRVRSELQQQLGVVTAYVTAHNIKFSGPMSAEIRALVE